MTKLLIKLFIKNLDEKDSIRLRLRYGMLSSIVGIVSNIVLFLLKLFTGIFSGSVSIIADAFNNLSDMASSVIALIGVKWSQKPADKKHPFGHGRIEYIAAFIISIAIVQVGLRFLRESISKISHPTSVTVHSSLILILIISIIVKIWLSMFNRYIARKIKSNIVKSVSIDCINDAIMTSIILISFIFTYFYNINIDGVAGLIISIIIIKAGVELSIDTISPLIGSPINKDEYEKIKNAVESYDKIIDTHDLIIHNYGENNKMATIHAMMYSDMNIMDAHLIIDKIEKDILDKFDIFLVIHIDPIEKDNKKFLILEKKIEDIIKNIDKNLSIHDFRIIYDEKINILFDLVVPYEYMIRDKEILLNDIILAIKKLNSNYECIITVDRNLVDD